jgi:hypothetical protein
VALDGKENLMGTFKKFMTKPATQTNPTKLRQVTANGDNYWGAYKTSKGTYLLSTPNGLLRSTNAGTSFTNTGLLVAGAGYPVTGVAHTQFFEKAGQVSVDCELECVLLLRRIHPRLLLRILAHRIEAVSIWIELPFL